ncbi:endonuclease/exonuclease/phosphatase family protein [Clostridium chauvoei]|uniref:endonuclease/exonuclease/phosphatase family protein n=1 Tax=Clostridium chauvoei TaxID=46867 RepID=UPI001C844A66|nr:endonuclease/exonuclease/phosphatase family protein [Clostridium chauvoei]MBX7346689.1 endonuclease/exonuclease/phosphatase family protein [Clostridium chauvoei]
MKVMTFNLRTDFILAINNRWKNRRYIVYEVINKYQCDIIGVQELTEKMLKDISKNIENYNIVGRPRAQKLFVERNDLLVSKKHQILEHNTFWLSNKPEEVGTSVWYSMYPRICTTAAIKLNNNKIIRVYNTHLDCLLPKAREYGLKKIGEYIEKQYDKDGFPVILMGDFNANPNSDLIKKFLKGDYTSKKLTAVQEFKKDIYGVSTMSKFKGNKKGYHIDYIFTSEEFNVKDTSIVEYNKEGKYPSDHYPLIAELQI